MASIPAYQRQRSIPAYQRQRSKLMADAEFDTGIKADEAEVVLENTEPKEALKGRKPSAKKLRHMDSLQMEAGNVSSIRSHGAKAGWGITMHLAFQSIGVVYGDIGTSPLYVYASTFTDGIKDKEDILGVLSLILYTLLLIPLTKYALIVLWANDNGNGGAFALYSLISRYAKVSLLPNQQAEDAMLSNYKLATPSTQMKRAQWIKTKLESSKVAKVILIFLTILGTSMIMGDGVLTPCISVLSAVSGIQQKATFLTEGKIAIISIIILIMLFSVQRFGIDKVGYAFAPVILIWFILIGGIGMYNLIKYDVRVLRAFNPKYIVDYFRRNGKHGWISLGGVVLCITGAEAMFADLGHFNVRAIQISFTAILLPSVSLAYIGQAAYLTKFPENVSNTFYKSIPGPLFWPTFIVAVGAAIIASQAVISCVFSIIAQAQTLGCFPRVKVVHTSAKYEGQVYIPELNFALMTACILVTGSFRTTEHIGNAYGIAVICDMTITTCLVTLIMLVIWQKSIWKIVLFFVVFAGTELTYLSSVLSKFIQGGFLPLVFSFFLMQIMAIWHYVHVKRYIFEVENKISISYIKDLAHRHDIKRISGIGFLYSELVEGIPPIFAHFIEKVPSIHSVMVFVSVKHLPISNVELQERFLFRQVEPREYRIYRCVVRYGYKDAIEEPGEFENLLIAQLKNFIHNEYFIMESWRSKQSNRLQEEVTLTNTPNPSDPISDPKSNKTRTKPAAMSYYRGGGRAGAHEEADDFDEYDPTPYGGGYDLHLTFGRPIDPSDETCYPISTATSSIDYDRPSYNSGSKPSAYEPDPDSDDRYGHSSSSRPKPQPAYGFQPKPQYGGGGDDSEYGSGYSKPKPKPEYGYGGGSGESEYGSGYSKPKPEYGHGGGSGESEYGSGYSKPKPEYGSGYGGVGGGESEYGSGYSKPKPEYGYGGGGGGDSEYGSGYSKPKPKPKPEYGSGYGGGENEYGSGYSKPEPKYGSGYGGGESEYVSGYSKPKPKPEAGYGGGESEYGSGYSKPKPEYGSGYGGSEYRKPSYGGGDDEEGSGRYKKSEEYGYGGGRSNYERSSVGGGDEEESGRYKKSEYGGGRSNYEKPSYGGGDEEESGRYNKSSHYGQDEGEGYGRPKYGNNDSDDDEKKRHHHKHHHRRNNDDD